MNIIQHNTYTTYSDLHFINVLRLNNAFHWKKQNIHIIGKSSKGIYRLRQHCKRKMMDKQNKE